MSALNAADESFLAAAPVIHSETIEVPVPPEVVWRELTGDKALSWLGMKLVWGPQRTGVGATRQIGPPVGPKASEKFFIWDDGTRKTFYIEKLPVPAPGLRTFVEDYVIEPTDKGAKFTWTFALDGAGPFGNSKLATPVVRAILKLAMKRTQRYFERLAGQY